MRPSLRRCLALHAVLVGLLYALYGLLELANGVVNWWTPFSLDLQLGVKVAGAVVPYAMSDPFSGLALLVTGLVFLRGAGPIARGEAEAWGYATVALLLSGTVAAVSLLVAAADALDAYYPLLWGSEPRGDWSPLRDPWLLNPGLLLSPLTLLQLITYSAYRPRGRGLNRPRRSRTP